MDPAKLKVVELRAALAERGLDTKGNKPVLVERLRKALEEEEDGQGCKSRLLRVNKCLRSFAPYVRPVGASCRRRS